MAIVCVMFRRAALVPPYGAEGAARFGLYEVMEAVNTIEPVSSSQLSTPYHEEIHYP